MVVLPDGGLIVAVASGGGDGANGCGTILGISAEHVVRILHRFSNCTDGPESDGDTPAGMVLGLDGLVYGTMTVRGGEGKCGTLYRTAPDGSAFEVLHRFRCGHESSPQSDGWLVRRADGTIYGLTALEVFSWSPEGVFGIVHAFGSGGTRGAGLSVGTDGSLYGVLPSDGRDCRGSLFRISPQDEYSIVFDFADLPSAHYPVTPPVERGGWLYGVARGGAPGHGVVYKLRPDGTQGTEIYAFIRRIRHDGTAPLSALAQAPNGALVGTTYRGGMTSDADWSWQFGLGTVYWYTPSAP